MTNDYGNLELHTVLLAAMKDIDKICREYAQQVKNLIADLKKRKLFQSVPYRYTTDRIRMMLLLNFPFVCYRKIMHRRRKYEKI
jgi:hypothetical protein